MACQMEASRTDKIQVDIGTPEGDMVFHSAASRLNFKGYQAVYEDTEASTGSTSDNSEGDSVHDGNFEALSKLKVKDSVSPVSVHLAQHFTKPPSRYSEGALIKNLEELGIGRPSTYASIMKVLQLETFLEEKFGSIIFRDLDSDGRICPSCFEGTLRFNVSRYGKGYFVDCDRHPKCKYTAGAVSQEDGEPEASEDTLPMSFTPRLLGVTPDSDEKVFLKQGPYGYYVQVGEDKKGVFRKRASLTEVKDVDSVTIEDAIEMLQYPKVLGKHPDDDHPVVIKHSKTGFYIRRRRFFAPVPKSMDGKKITLECALKLLTGKNIKRLGRPKGKSNQEPFEWH